MGALFKYQNSASGQGQTALAERENHIPQLNIFLMSSSDYPGHKYITTESWSYVQYAQGIRSEFHIGMLVEKSTFWLQWRSRLLRADIGPLVLWHTLWVCHNRQTHRTFKFECFNKRSYQERGKPVFLQGLIAVSRKYHCWKHRAWPDPVSHDKRGGVGRRISCEWQKQEGDISLPRFPTAVTLERIRQ